MKYLFLLICFTCFASFGQQFNWHDGFMRKKENAYFFYEVRHDSLLAPRYVVFTDNDTTGLYDTTTYKEDHTAGEKQVVAWGNKSDTTRISYNSFNYQKITIEGVRPYTMQNFQTSHYSRVSHVEQDTTLEGYYMNRFETLLFWPITDGKVSLDRGWTRFENIDIDYLDSTLSGKLRHGVYMKLKGRVRYGHDRYGHMGMSKFDFKVAQILKVDTTNLLNAHLARDLEAAPIVYRGDTTYAPKDFEYKRVYNYTGMLKKYTVKLVIEKTAPGQLRYHVDYYKNKKLIKKRSGILLLNTWLYMIYYREGYGEYSYEEYISKDLNSYEPDVIVEMPLKVLNMKQPDFYFTDRLFSKKNGVKIAMHLQKE